MTSTKPEHVTSLLVPGDPDPVELVNEMSDFPVVLVCEHAGQAIPHRLADLGVAQVALDDHIGWDIGARAVTLRLAETLGAPAVLQRYSRLVIDCNRPPEAPDSIPEISDGVAVPGNASLSAGARNVRIRELFMPFHEATSALLRRRTVRATFAIHSFTPRMNGRSRPWDISFLYRKDSVTSLRLQAAICALQPQLRIGMNEPYQIDDASDWFVPRHGEASCIAHSLIEIRNDHIVDAEGQRRWADLLAETITMFLDPDT